MRELTPEILVQGLIQYIVLLFSLSVHECCHALIADKMGDPTGRLSGRVTLNPIPHMDILGTVVFPLLMIFGSVPAIGWAKPVPVSPVNFRDMKKGHITVAAAGPLSYLSLAFIFSMLYSAVSATSLSGRPLAVPLFVILEAGLWVNAVLAIFNLFPIPPLDGSHIVSWALPREWGDAYDRHAGRYGFVVFLLLFITGAFGYILIPIATAIVLFFITIGDAIF